TFTEATDSVTVTLTDGQVRVDSLTVYTGSSSTPDVPEIVVPATLAEQIAAANALANKNYLPYQSTITGTVTDDPQASSYNEGQYKFTVSDGTNTLLCYFVPVTGGTPKKGDTVTVTGYLTAYNGSAQFDDSAAGTWVKAGEVAPEPKPEDPAADSTLTIAEALALGASKAHNTYTAGKYYVVGEITEVYNTQYGNMKIKDAEGNILTIYGTYSADGSTRYDAMDVKPVAGDTVKVYGIIGQFNGTAQIKNGWIVEHTPAETPVEPDPKPADPTPDTTLTIKDALALGASKDHNTYTEGKYYVVGEITEVYNTQYGNMKIKDAEGNILTVYGTYSADGSTRYDAMDVKPVAGDTVKVYGIVGQFNGTAQIKNGWIVEHTPAETPETNVPETNVPKTGDVMIVLVSAVLLAGAAITLIARKRRCN
ncbi:MAG: OB-fold nucleic acid binding domain-containing protein, partial [Clostridia bacterium]|nr:OB-fold nucleic acid binding domain-containing protein [Clostridia bacterium]